MVVLGGFDYITTSVGLWRVNCWLCKARVWLKYQINYRNFKIFRLTVSVEVISLVSLWIVLCEKRIVNRALLFFPRTNVYDVIQIKCNGNDLRTINARNIKPSTTICSPSHPHPPLLSEIEPPEYIMESRANKHFVNMTLFDYCTVCKHLVGKRCDVG